MYKYRKENMQNKTTNSTPEMVREGAVVKFLFQAYQIISISKRLSTMYAKFWIKYVLSYCKKITKKKKSYETLEVILKHCLDVLDWHYLYTS